MKAKILQLMGCVLAGVLVMPVTLVVLVLIASFFEWIGLLVLDESSGPMVVIMILYASFACGVVSGAKLLYDTLSS